MTKVLKISLLNLSHLLCLMNPNQEASQGTHGQQKRGAREAEDTTPSLLYVPVGADDLAARMGGYGVGFLWGNSLL